MTKQKPARGEVWMTDLGLAAKVRPVLVLSVAILDNERHLYGIVPHTTSLWHTRFEAVTNVRWLKPGGFDAQGLRPVPIAAFERRLGILDNAHLRKVEDAVLLWTGIRRDSPDEA